MDKDPEDLKDKLKKYLLEVEQELLRREELLAEIEAETHKIEFELQAHSVSSQLLIGDAQRLLDIAAYRRLLQARLISLREKRTEAVADIKMAVERKDRVQVELEKLYEEQ